MRVKDVKDRLVIFIFLLGYVSGVTLRHKHSKVGLKRHMRREMELGVRYTNLPFVSYEAQNNSVVEAQVGGSASLKCFTENLGEELVTWLKRDDEQLLTAGPQVYSSENRYSVSHMKHQKLWELRIRDVRMSDRGLYECQLTTHPPISILIDLKVVEARAVIRGPKDVHVHEGSRLRLVCHVKEATELPLYVFWFHNGSMVNYEARRPLTVTKQRFVSALIISNVSRSDAGSYRCEPSNAKSDNITLHVVADENSAAMQRGLEKKKLRDQNVSSIPILKTSSNSAEEATSFSCLIFFLVCFVHTLSAVSHGNVTETALEILRRAFSRLTNAGGVRADRWRKSGIVPPNVKMKKKRTSPPVRSRCLFTRGKTIVWVVWGFLSLLRMDFSLLFKCVINVIASLFKVSLPVYERSFLIQFCLPHKNRTKTIAWES